MTEPAVGASTWASGNQVCTGHIGSLTAKDARNANQAQVCSERGIALIFDEILVGFRLAPGGAQEYFGVRADMVTYGKTVAGGFPIGVLCGKRELMRRFYESHPADICFARGTFNSHPYVMGAMLQFLQRLVAPEIRDIYRDLDRVWNERAARLNSRLREQGLPEPAHNPNPTIVIQNEPKLQPA